MRFALSLGMALVVGVCYADEIKDLNGTWLPQEGMAQGQNLPDDFIKKSKLVMTDGKYQVTLDNAEIDKGKVTVDDKKSPKQMTIVSEQGMTIRAIYEFKADSLKVCYETKEMKYPTEFKSTAENKWLLITYKRSK